MMSKSRRSAYRRRSRSAHRYQAPKGRLRRRISGTEDASQTPSIEHHVRQFPVVDIFNSAKIVRSKHVGKRQRLRSAPLASRRSHRHYHDRGISRWVSIWVTRLGIAGQPNRPTSPGLHCRSEDAPRRFPQTSPRVRARYLNSRYGRAIRWNLEDASSARCSCSATTGWCPGTTPRGRSERRA